MPIAIAEQQPNRRHRRREVYAKPCPKCNSRETRVVGRYGRKRYCKCHACGNGWHQLPPYSQFN